MRPKPAHSLRSMQPSPVTARFTRQWLPIGLGQLVALACGLAGVHLVTRWVRPEDLGVYGLFLSLVPLGGMLTHAGLIKHFSRHWQSAADKPAYLRHWLAGTLQPTLGLLGAGILVAALGVLSPVAVLGAFVLVAAGLAGALAQAFQLGVQSIARHWLDLGLTATNSLTRTFLPLLGVALTGAGIVALLGGFLLHALIAAAAGFLFIVALGRSSRTTAAVASTPPASLQTYTRLFLLNGALALINQGIVRWCVGLAFGVETLGYVTMAGNLAAVGPSMLAGALWQYHYPRLLHAHHRADDTAVRRLADRTLAWMIGGCVAGGLLLAALLPWLPGRLVALEYVDAIGYIMPLFAFYAGLCGLSLVQGESLVMDRPEAALRVTAAGTIALSGGTLLCTLVWPEHLQLWWWVSPLPALVAARLMLRRKPAGPPPPTS